MLGGSKADIQRQDSELKKYGLLTLGIVIVGITLTAGVTAAYLIAAVAGFSAAILYPQNIEEWFNAHRMLLIGSLVGFFIGGATLGPITMVLGGFLGHLVEQPVNLAVNAANKTVDAYQKVSNGMSQVTELPNNAWNGLKSGFDRTYRYFIGNETSEVKPEVKADPITEPKTTLSILPVATSEIIRKPIVAKKVTSPVTLKETPLLPAINRPQTLKSNVQRVHPKRVRKTLTKPVTAKPSAAKPDVVTAPSTQSIWQSFCAYFANTQEITPQDTQICQVPTSLALNPHKLSVAKSKSTLSVEKRKKREPILTIM